MSEAEALSRLDPAALAAYRHASSSKPVNLRAFASFIDPPQHDQRTLTKSQVLLSEQGGWDSSTGVDWSMLNGSRDLSLGVSETAVCHPDTRAGQMARQRLDYADSGQPLLRRTTDARTGHTLLRRPVQKERFVRDAYMMRIEDARRAEEGKKPEHRVPQPTLYNGMCTEAKPNDEAQKNAMEEREKRKKERAQYLATHARSHLGAPSDTSPSASASASASSLSKFRTGKRIVEPPFVGNAKDSYQRLFHTDLPSFDELTYENSRTAAGFRREQYIRDKTSGGRDHYPISNVRIKVVPPSQQAQIELKLNERNAVARQRMDERNASRAQEEKQQTSATT